MAAHPAPTADVAGTASIAVEALHPNDYNPNRMTEAEFGELVAEVRHLGRLPKPVVARPDGEGYLIVDGEHGWRAAQEAGLSEVPCEVVDVDDFEAMRQTYKRNQHGTHDPVLLGRMFRRMLADRGLSRRDLATEMEVSDGTVRNALLYVEAAELRNSYADRDDVRARRERQQQWVKGIQLPSPEAEIARLSVRQVREYMKLPAPIRDIWLEAGADLKLLAEAGIVRLGARGVKGKRPVRMYDPDADAGKWGLSEEDSVAPWKELVEAGLDACLSPTRSQFVPSVRRAFRFLEWRRRYGREFDADGYLQPLLKLRFPEPLLLDLLPCRMVDGKVEPVMSPERWERLIRDMFERGKDTGERWAIYNAGRDLAMREAGLGEGDRADPRVAALLAIVRDGPAFIRDADIPLHEKAGLVEAKPLVTVPEDAVVEAKRRALGLLVEQHRYVTGIETRLKNLPLLERLQAEEELPGGGPPIRRVWPRAAFDKCLEAVINERRAAALDALFAGRGQLMAALMGRFRERYSLSTDKLWRALETRLYRLPFPELVMLAAFALGDEKAALKRWYATAHDPATADNEFFAEAERAESKETDE
jgi:ParB-like chromosome segregation protein Spo0J